MNSNLVFTFIGPDRPGLVEQLSELVANHGGNWLESRMIEMDGQFAGIARIELPSAEAPVLINALKGLNPAELTVNVQTGTTAPEDATLTERSLHILGADRPGIVREISRALKARHINVSEMSSNVRSAPMSAEALFEAHISVEIPAGVAFEELEDQLDEIAEKLGVDISCD